MAHLAFALDLARTLVIEFWDADDGTLYYTPAGGETLLARPQELTDQSTPSSAGVAVEVLTRLAAFAPEERFDEVAQRTVETHAETIVGKTSANPIDATAETTIIHRVSVRSAAASRSGRRSGRYRSYARLPPAMSR